jgi:ferredoxin
MSKRKPEAKLKKSAIVAANANDSPPLQKQPMPIAASQPLQATESQVRIEPAGWVCSAAPLQSILQATQQAGIALPSACRNGTCRTCLSQLVSGEIGYLIEWPGVSSEERQQGLFLPCVACARSDIVIDQPIARRSSEFNVT